MGSFKATPLFPVKVVTTKRTTKASSDNALNAVQNHSLMIHLNPLVIACSQDEQDNELWHIKDTIKMLGYPMHIEYQARMVKTEDGIDVSSKAGFGTVLTNHWHVRAVAGQVEISENVEVQAFRLFMPFVTRLLQSSHENLICRLVDRLEGENDSHLVSS